MSTFFTQFRCRKISGVTAKGGKTKQAALADADINLILKKYNLTKIPPPTSAPIYADRVILPKTLEDAMGVIDGAFDWFEQLPSEVRSVFQNDPVQALRMVNDNLPEAVKKGLIPSNNFIIAKAVETATPEPPKDAAKDPLPADPKNTEPPA